MSDTFPWYKMTWGFANFKYGNRDVLQNVAKEKQNFVDLSLVLMLKV